MLGSWQGFIVVGIAVIFVGFLLWKYRPTLSMAEPLVRSYGWRSRHSPEVTAKIKEALERARNAKSPRERSEALVAAAESAAIAPDGTTSAIGFYLRAMRADVSHDAPVQGIATLLSGERPELLEHILWRRLSRLDGTDHGGVAVKATLDALVALYQGELRHKERARALKRLSTRL
ncbi:MAG: hypothetical protein ABW133_14805 [Polyangiaceae bacterium]